ncbi:hemolysin III [Clostridium tetanomorphum]|uniref:PAQR family membrane homeostasis protein TrhA n=1 Tax=Clostridium tetanomorphum TaxID=1553 RepID=UPI000451EA42|nr:hemolysin III family protein [Clostridium tetanomorphum]KAJ49873.1 hemolysin III [Clostridium tetanomorphum DSM 665]MBP1866492.1 hemolysin III [Clostridium tetanomorphum]NRS84181.1 hemolysin III [Clostridium tetanomorphum]
MFQKFRDPISGLTHLIGAFLSLIGMIILIKLSMYKESIWAIISFSIFGVSLLLLYTASSTYHIAKVSKKVINILRKIDHSMIYILIAGTYTPICILTLKGYLGFTLFTIVWFLAILGVIFKLFWFNCPRKLSTAFYIIMGWLVIFFIVPITKVLSLNGFMWLLLGGIFYTLGGVIYALKWPKINSKLFGFHEIFHIFVMLGSLCHYCLMLKLISLI